ncbi:U4/U6 small nuclear ribonucleoprotein Prp31-like [Pecten maximus]|uniref:U4/U6 small nuclear ribonucleoprotein Prp31-like n=1 Tax=Pecten maximus TaxID=6579 RepID=UPI001457F247|nr:U4/U6 small nuclear ribonucleoprotein Prp31-like [Pecten maximus]XP_033751538.1 U4/U6 small nuclear ribonucleoprotein Prp31-like [Pecten maximus]XP_033751546.1 U4/U6 small nuclear ribonucleoprotein Prp31-like [Pecten maximus]XP_033751554.1 U4/U6 small nuclear ribonucleoprotein Prp31-like [Pecten maximus]
MSLADELIADYEDADDDLDEHEAEVESMDIAEVDEKAEVDYKDKETVKSVAKLRDSEQLANILVNIEKYASQPRRQKVAGPVEADPEYKLIVEANNITVEIDNEINVIHKFTRDHYSKRFPELESLIQTPMEYIKTVKELGNNIMENSKKNEVLQEILVPATIMVVSVTASTTPGTSLTAEEMITVMEACDMAIDLTEYKAKIFSYVESRMTFIAPNVTIIVGASISAKLMGTAGGLTNLSKMPACNVQSLGAQRKTLSGFSMASIQPHMGYIYNCDIVQKTPPELRKKAARLVSAKCTLAARVDSFHESVDGSVGDSLRAEIDGKLDKLLEPPPVKTVKALPTPIDAARKKRGGRRARKMKERLGLTEVRKAANRMNFGEIEEDAYQDDLGFSLGTLGKSASGRIRGPVVDSKTKAKISKTLQLKVQKQNQTWGGSTTVKRQVSGTASSVAFTPLQGLEIVNPQAAEKKVSGGSSTYFSSTGSFVNVKHNR